MTGIPLYTPSPLSMSSSEEAPAGTNPTISDPKEDFLENASPLGASSMKTVPPMLETPNPQAQSPASLSQNHTSPIRSVPRLNTRTSMSGSSLSWQTDMTSSPYTPTSHGRKLSFAPPPRTNAGRYRPSISSSPTLPQLQTTTVSNYSIHPPSSLYTSSSSHVIDLSNPLGYAQNARASFSDRVPYENHTPFYENSYSSSFSSPQTPTRRGRGILDNDPAIYLGGEGDGEQDSVWDTAARWANSAVKRLSEGEQQIWRMVEKISEVGNDTQVM